MGRIINQEHLAIITIWQEARGEPQAGKVAVAQVIKNRIARQYQSDGTITGTVLKPYQFSGWNTKDPSRGKGLQLDEHDAVYLDCAQAWRTANEDLYELFPAVLFHAVDLELYPSWSRADGVTKLKQIGNHIFYTDTN